MALSESRVFDFDSLLPDERGTFCCVRNELFLDDCFSSHNNAVGKVFLLFHVIEEDSKVQTS